MIPLITSEMLSHNWMTYTEVSDIVAIAEMTPGPLGLNCATFAGMRTAGILGAIVANLGVMLPTLTLTAIIAVFYNKFKENTIMQKLLTGIRPACVGMIFGIAISLSIANYFPDSTLNSPALAISIVDFILLLKYKIGIPYLMGINATLGIILFGIIGL